ncbi:MAG: DUF362 domain-containing protein [Fusicatenibacter sp.]|nr:DUF362 domain-containing protein [Fusicatenibacter sp.]
MEKNESLLIHGTDYMEMTKKLLQEAELEKQIPGRESRIGIKPNLVAPSPAEWGATTHPEIVAGIIEYLQGRGFHHLVIMEGSWVGDRTSESFEVCGYRELSERYQVPLIDAQKEPFLSCDCGGLELQICSCAKQVDFMINVPVMKGHCQTKITCALKNMKGLLPNREKRHFHAMGLHRPIAHLGLGISQNFIVVDNICGDLDFEDGGNPVVMNRIFAGQDPVLVDAFVCEQLHYTKEEVPYVLLAEKLGVGSADLSQMKLRYLNEAGTVQTRISQKRKIVELKDAVEEVESCSACYGYLIPTLDRLREEGLLGKLAEKICIGQGFRGKEGNLGIGSCTSCFSHSLKGCPPTEEQMYEFLKAYLECGAGNNTDGEINRSER